MNLLCSLDWHRPELLPRWQDGLYFSRCRGCGRDLYRAPKDRWHTLPDYWIDWRDPAPPGTDLPIRRGTPPHSPSDAGARAAPAIAKAPIVAIADPADTESAGFGAPAGGDVRAARPDPSEKAAFMFDEAADRQGAPDPTAQSPPSAEPSPVPERKRILPGGAGLRLLWIGAALAGAGMVAGVALTIMLVATLVARFTSQGPAPPATVAAAPAPAAVATAAPRRQADFVVAQRSGRCSRAQRRRGRNNAPGQEIRLRTSDGHWVSLSRPGTRCWTLRAGEEADSGR